MKRALLVVAAVVLAVVAVLVLRGVSERSRASDERADARDGATVRGAGGVGERASDLSAAAIVRGEIVDEDEQPIEGGTVTLTCLDGDEVRRIPGGIVAVGEDGTFEGPGCRQRICAELDHPYLLPAEPWVLAPGSASVLQARSARRLYGRVLAGADDAPVPNARVTFMPPEGEDDPTSLIPMRTRSTVTDAEGTWSVAWIEAPPCSPCVEASTGCPDPPPLHDEFRVMVVADGYAAVALPLGADDAVGASADEPWVIRLPRALDLLTGTLLDGEGRAYARAYVLARSIERPDEQRRADVDPTTGIFEVDGLGEGRYGLRALADGVELATGEAAAGDHVELVGTHAGAGADLVVEVRRNGAAVPDAVVDGGPFRGERTDMKGQVSAPSVLVGTIALRVRAPGWPAVRHEIAIAPPDPDASGDSIHAVVELPAS